LKTGSFIHFDHPSVAVHWEDEDRIVLIQWKKAADSATFRAAMNAGFDLITQKKGHRWLADCVRMGPVAVEDTRWVTEEWTTRAITLGIKRIAFVMPQRASASISVIAFVTGPGGEKVPTMQFGDIGDARRWLREQR